MRETRIYEGAAEPLVLPDHLARWDVHAYWEREVYDSMLANREADERLMVIGAEHGYMAALWSRLMGGAAVLVEPSPPFWRNIRLTWQANGLPHPKLCVPAFVGAEANGITTFLATSWPESAYPDEECPAQEYRYLFNEKHVLEIPCTTVDTIVAAAGQAPTSLTCDTEGAEVLIVQGMRQTLADNDVKCWMSIHPDLIERDYPGYSADSVHDEFAELGYKAEHLSTDHEEHWLFSR